MSLTQNICRVCLDLEKRNKFVKLSPEISLKIANLSLVQVRQETLFTRLQMHPLQVTQTDDTVALICQKCIKDVNFADSIRLKCIEAEKFFESLLDKFGEPAPVIEVKQEDVIVQTFIEELESVEINYNVNYEKATEVEVLDTAIKSKKT